MVGVYVERRHNLEQWIIAPGFSDGWMALFTGGKRSNYTYWHRVQIHPSKVMARPSKRVFSIGRHNTTGELTQRLGT